MLNWGLHSRFLSVRGRDAKGSRWCHDAQGAGRDQGPRLRQASPAPLRLQIASLLVWVTSGDGVWPRVPSCSPQTRTCSLASAEQPGAHLGPVPTGLTGSGAVRGGGWRPGVGAQTETHGGAAPWGPAGRVGRNPGLSGRLESRRQSPDEDTPARRALLSRGAEAVGVV